METHPSIYAILTMGHNSIYLLILNLRDQSYGDIS